MKRPVMALCLLLALSTNACAKGGPVIPSPKYPMTQAAQIAEKYLRSHYPDDGDILIKDYMLRAVEYTNEYDGQPLADWMWVVTFTHPAHNDNNYVLSVDSKGAVTLVTRTE